MLPELAPDPWIAVGSGASLVDDGVQIADASALDPATYTHELTGRERIVGPSRASSWVWLTARVRGVSAAAAWASGASPIGLWIDDGTRAVAVSIGSTLAWIDPYTGDVVDTIATSWPWLTARDYVLEKVGSDRWRLRVDGRLLAELPYTAAVASAGPPALVGFGSLDPVGVSTAVFDAVEASLNQAVAPPWKVAAFVRSLPISIQSRWNALADAAARATVGLLETVVRLLDEAWRELGAARVALRSASFKGDVLPSLAVPAWTLENAGALSVERQRLLMEADGITKTGVHYDVTLPGTGVPDDVEWALRATWRVESYTPDAQGRVGPYMQAVNGHGRITLQLVEVVAGESWAWVFTNDQLVGAYATFGVQWPVNPYAEHVVELRVLGRDWVLLIIDQQIVERWEYSAFTSGPSGTFFELASSGGGASAVGVWTVRDVSGVVYLCDLYRRPLLLQSAVERLVFVGGCERNDEIESWNQHHHDVEALRGTTQGIVVETRRLTCGADAAVIADDGPIQWFLEETYPEITPIYLEAAGSFAVVHVEFRVGALNFTPQQLADLLARYLVPVSVPELRYEVCLAATLTGNTTVPAPGTTRVTVASTSGFEVGAAVTIRDAANTVQEDHVVTAIVSATVLEIDETSAAPYVAGDVIRTVLATT